MRKRDAQSRTRVFLARHGQVENYDAGVYNGQRDVAVTVVGLEQMHALIPRLRDQGVTAVYCSDLSRTVEGAEVIASALDLPYQSIADLRERNFGAWEGLSFEEIGIRYPDLFESWRTDVTAVRPPGGGENSYDVSRRVLGAYLPLVEKHRGESIFIVAHGGVNRVILAHALNLDVRHILRMDQVFGCLNLIDYYEDGFAHVRLMNG